MEKIEFNLDDSIKELKEFKQYIHQVPDSINLADVPQSDLLSLYSNLEIAKANLTQLKELLG